MVQIVDKAAWTPVRENRVLFARSCAQKLFYCVGGKRNKGESYLQALMREVKEETGVLIVASTIKHIRTFEGPCHGYSVGTILKMACYEAEHFGQLVPSSEVE